MYWLIGLNPILFILRFKQNKNLQSPGTLNIQETPGYK